MAECTRRVRKVSGAVLMMVVTIMFVLVIMLLATLTVVSNTSKRTVSKFEENQAYYTARSVVEVYIDEILENENKVSSSSATSTVKSAWEKMGFTFDPEADGSTNKYLGYLNAGKDFVNSDALEGFVHQQEIFGFLTPKYKLDTANIIDSTTYKEQTDKSVRDPNAWVQDTSLDESKYTLTYEATLPDMKDKKIEGRDAGVLASSGKVTVRLELLRLVYLTQDKVVLYDGHYSVPDSIDSGVSEDSAKIYDGGRIKISKVDMNNTYFRLKVSATASIANATGGYSERTVSVMLEPGAPPPAPPENGRDAVSASAGSGNADNLEVFGGMMVKSDGTTTEFHLQNNSAFVGNVVLLGYNKMDFSTSPNAWMMSKNEYYFLPDGYIELTSNITRSINGRGDLDSGDGEEVSKRPFLYTKGFYMGTNGLNIGTNRMNGTNDGSTFDCACDIITVKNPQLGSDKGVSGFKNAVANNAAFIFDGQNPHTINGDVYVDGDMYIKKYNNPGDLVFNGEVYCTGKIYLGGNSLNNQNADSIFKKNVYATGIVDTNDTSVTDKVTKFVDVTSESWVSDALNSKCMFNAQYAASIRTDDEKEKLGYRIEDIRDLEIPLPKKGVTGDVVKKVSTMPPDDEYGHYVYNSNPNDDGYEYYPVLTAYKNVTQATSGGLNQTGKKIKDCIKDTSTFDSGVSIPGVNKIIKDFGSMNSDGIYVVTANAQDFQNDSGTYYIDATKGKCIQVVLTGSLDSACPKFIVVGDGAVYVTVPKEGQSGGEVEWKSGPSFTPYEHDSSNEWYIGSNNDDEHPMDDSMGPGWPQIYYFVDEGLTYKFRNYNGYNAATFVAPDATIVFTGNGNGKSIKYSYDMFNGSGFGAPSPTANDVRFSGSIIAKHLDTQNKITVMKPRPKKGDNGGGGNSTSMITWKRQRYLNR